MKPDCDIQIYHAKITALKKKIDVQRKCIKRLNTTSIKPALSAKRDIETVKALSFKYMKPEAYQFFSGQLDRSLIKKREMDG